MGFTNTSPTGGPVFTASPPQTVADLNRLRQFVEERGNLSIGTSLARGAVTGDPKYDGRHWWDTTDKVLYVNNAGTWTPLRGLRSTTAGLAYLGNGVYGNAPQMRIAKHDEIVTTNFAISKAYAFSDGDQPGDFPTGFRPAVEVRGVGQFAGSGALVPGYFSIATSGRVTLSGSPGAHTLFFAPIAFETP